MSAGYDISLPFPGNISTLNSFIRLGLLGMAEKNLALPIPESVFLPFHARA
jgi:hypothetical protein